MYSAFIYTGVFYTAAFLVIYVFTKISPNAHDGGLGLGGLLLLVLPLIVLVLAGLNVYWGIRLENYYFIIAGIHFCVLVTLIVKLFI